MVNPREKEPKITISELCLCFGFWKPNAMDVEGGLLLCMRVKVKNSNKSLMWKNDFNTKAPQKTLQRFGSDRIKL